MEKHRETDPASVVVVGAGGLCREVLWLLGRLNRKSMRWSIEGIVTRVPSAESQHAGYPVLGDDSWLLGRRVRTAVAIGVGSRPRVRSIVEFLSANEFLWFPSLVDPSSVCEGDVVDYGSGNIVLPGVTFTANITIGSHNLFNPGCTISHDVEIGDFCALGPGAHIAGGVRVGSGVQFGTGASILPGIQVHDGATVGAGAVVTKDIAPFTTVTGVPARPLVRT